MKNCNSEIEFFIYSILYLYSLSQMDIEETEKTVVLSTASGENQTVNSRCSRK